MNSDGAVASLNNLFGHRQTEAEALAVDQSCPLQLAETSKELGEVFSSNSGPRVLHVDDQLAAVVACADLNFSLEFREFQCVLKQVDEHLL